MECHCHCAIARPTPYRNMADHKSPSNIVSRIESFFHPSKLNPSNLSLRRYTEGAAEERDEIRQREERKALAHYVAGGDGIEPLAAHVQHLDDADRPLRLAGGHTEPLHRPQPGPRLQVAPAQPPRHGLGARPALLDRVLKGNGLHSGSDH